ncbi:MAG TPA: DUF1501 domain-containing protein [Planctomycetota bacterium]|nr:DUF1501 domain-containing protein [Planctomycetota bacterium]
MCTRRQFLVGSVFGLSLADALAWARDARGKSCILVWLNGGPSHLDMFDLKPEAPAEIRGEFRPGKSALEGVRVNEQLPRLGALLDRCTLIRSVTSPEGNHDRASHYMLTGYRPTPALVYPSLGSVAAKEFGVGAALPSVIAVPAAPQYGGAGFLSAAFEPFSVHSDPSRDFRVKDLEAPVDADRLDRRRSMLAAVDRFCDSVGELPGRDSFLEQAFGLVTSKEARAAFDLTREEPKARTRYGPSRVGQSCLLARRLIEAGARFVTVNDDGWDTHDNAGKRLAGTFNQGKQVYAGKLPDLDLAVSALLQDLDARGLLESTLVVVMGEFGRTPKLNALGGRDHWPRASSVLMAGGGARRGQVVGATDALGELPAERPVGPEDILRTVYQALGIDADREYRTSTGRPVRILDKGEVIREALE